MTDFRKLARENKSLKAELINARELLRLTWMTGSAASEEFAERVAEELDKSLSVLPQLGESSND
jgi:hypothetical protein